MNCEMNRQPDVSIAMMTYFHEKYVAEAIESVLSQITSYTYEIVVSDDGSEDGTRDILREYAKKYPDIIKVHMNERNLGISRNNYETRCRCTGRYIATLSGDDYWIDKEKLQKQVDFLDNHPNCFATVTAVEGRFDNSTEAFHVYPNRKYRDRYITLDMYLRGAGVGTHGLVMRNAYLTNEGRKRFLYVPSASPYIDDATECILILKESPVYSMDIRGVAYRVRRNKSGANNYNAQNTALNNFRKVVQLYNYLHENLDPQMDLFYLYKSNVAVALAAALLNRSFKDFNATYATIPNEYKSRGLKIRAIPESMWASFQSITRKLYAALGR